MSRGRVRQLPDGAGTGWKVEDSPMKPISRFTLEKHDGPYEMWLSLAPLGTADPFSGVLVMSRVAPVCVFVATLCWIVPRGAGRPRTMPEQSRERSFFTHLSSGIFGQIRNVRDSISLAGTLRGHAQDYLGSVPPDRATIRETPDFGRVRLVLV
jgi:hypothetical protein